MHSHAVTSALDIDYGMRSIVRQPTDAVREGCSYTVTINIRYRLLVLNPYNNASDEDQPRNRSRDKNNETSPRTRNCEAYTLTNGIVLFC
jgi:hypothetical protein